MGLPWRTRVALCVLVASAAVVWSSAEQTLCVDRNEEQPCRMSQFCQDNLQDLYYPVNTLDAQGVCQDCPEPDATYTVTFLTRNLDGTYRPTAFTYKFFCQNAGEAFCGLHRGVTAFIGKEGLISVKILFFILAVVHFIRQGTAKQV